MVLSISSYSEDKFNYSYYELMNLKIDDKLTTTKVKHDKYYYYEKIKSPKDNFILLSANVLMGSLCYMKYQNTEEVYGVSSKRNVIVKEFIVYDIILSVALITYRFIDD